MNLQWERYVGLSGRDTCFAYLTTHPELSSATIRQGKLSQPYPGRSNRGSGARPELTCLQQDQFDDYRESTIGAAFLTQTIALDETTTVKFEIW